MQGKSTFKRKGLIIAIFAIALIVAAGIGFYFNQLHTNSDMKDFTIYIQSDRDNYEHTYDCKSDLGTLGEYVRTMDDCTWEDSTYGTYITGWSSFDQDLDNQYWWAIYVGDEQSSNGADLIPLEDGGDYRFILVQGW